MMWDVLLWSKYFQLYSKCLECCCLPGCHCWCSLRCRFQTPIEELLDRGFGWNLHEDDGFPLLLQHRKQWANELVMTYQQEAEAGHQPVWGCVSAPGAALGATWTSRDKVTACLAPALQRLL